MNCKAEKIDVIKWSDNVEEYLSNALSPAEVVEIIPNKDEKTAVAIVDDYQLSLAISGKEGQNVRLAAKRPVGRLISKSKIDYVNQHKITTENTNDLADDILLELKEELESAEALDLIDESTADQELVYEDHSDLEF